MRKLAVALSLLMAVSAFGQMTEEEHLEHLRMMMHAMSQHGAVIPQPENLVGLATKTINMTAVTFSFNPNQITVNQGDVVTLNISVPTNDSSPVNPAHILLMETYIEQPVALQKGKTVTVKFVATTPGNFAFFCNQSSCGAGHLNMNGNMTVLAAPAGPTITTISPNSGPTTGGTSVSISGSGFQSGATVTFGGVGAQVTNVSSSSITVVTPLGPTSEQLTVDVVVTNPDGSSVTASGGFTYTVPPLQVTAISPNVGTTGGGETITITGQGFTSAVASSVTVGGVAATNVTIDSPVSMHATLPPHAVGVVDVVVTVGNSSVTKSGAITYELPPPRRRAARH